MLDEIYNNLPSRTTMIVWGLPVIAAGAALYSKYSFDEACKVQSLEAKEYMCHCDESKALLQGVSSLGGKSFSVHCTYYPDEEYDDSYFSKIVSIALSRFKPDEVASDLTLALLSIREYGARYASLVAQMCNYSSAEEYVTSVTNLAQEMFSEHHRVAKACVDQGWWRPEFDTFGGFSNSSKAWGVFMRFLVDQKANWTASC